MSVVIDACFSFWARVTLLSFFPGKHMPALTPFLTRVHTARAHDDEEEDGSQETHSSGRAREPTEGQIEKKFVRISIIVRCVLVVGGGGDAAPR